MPASTLDLWDVLVVLIVMTRFDLWDALAICEHLFACLCELLLHFVLGGLNFVEHGLAPVGCFSLQISFCRVHTSKYRFSSFSYDACYCVIYNFKFGPCF